MEWKFPVFIKVLKPFTVLVKAFTLVLQNILHSEFNVLVTLLCIL